MNQELKEFFIKLHTPSKKKKIKRFYYKILKKLHSIVYEITHIFKKKIIEQPTGRSKDNYILIMGLKMNRYLRHHEIVHHIDLNHSNNNIENLYLINNSKNVNINHSTHYKLHEQLNRLTATLINEGIIKFDKGAYLLMLGGK